MKFPLFPSYCIWVLLFFISQVYFEKWSTESWGRWKGRAALLTGITVWMTWILLFLQRLYKRSYIWTQSTNLENISYSSIRMRLNFRSILQLVMEPWKMSGFSCLCWILADGKYGLLLLKILQLFSGICPSTFVQIWSLLMKILEICWSTYCLYSEWNL